MTPPKTLPTPDTTASAILKELGLMVPVPTKDAALNKKVGDSFAAAVKAHIEKEIRLHASLANNILWGGKNDDELLVAGIPSFTIKLDCDLTNGEEDFSDVFEDLEPFIKVDGVDFSVNPTRDGDLVVVKFRA